MNDAPSELWLQHLRAELPFAPSGFAEVQPPANVRELTERLGEAFDALGLAVARACQGAALEDGAEPDWFVVLADRVLPLAAWMMGVGAPSAAEMPEGLREFAERARRVPGVGQALRLLGDLQKQLEQAFVQNERLRKQIVEAQAGYFLLLKVQVESRLAPLAGEGGAVSVRFDFPAAGQRVAELVPPPAPGSPTSGVVGRVLVPALTVSLQRGEAPPEVYRRGAHLRAR